MFILRNELYILINRMITFVTKNNVYFKVFNPTTNFFKINK